MADHLEHAVRAIEGVRWAAVNQATGRLAVEFDEGDVGIEAVIDTVEDVEDVFGLTDEGFPLDRAEHPGDDEPIRRQRWALAGDALAAGTAVFTGALRRNPVSSEVAALVGLIDSTPAFRRPLERRLGPAADLGLAALHAASQGLAGSPLSPMVDATHRVLLLRELGARRRLWEQREVELHGPRSGRVAALEVPGERAELPPGPVERYSSWSSWAGFAAAAGTLAGLRDPRLAVAVTVAGNPKGARLGREAFAATLCRILAERGVLAMDRDALRLLDRIDTVVLDADVLGSGRSTISSAWVAPGRHDEDELWLAARLLFDPQLPSAVQQSGQWWLGPIGACPARLDEAGLAARKALRSPGGALLCLCDSGEVVALARVEPELDPLAHQLASAARSAGTLLVAGLRSNIADRVGAAGAIRGGSRVAAEVRRLQQEGHGVVLVSARQRSALAAADLGIGVHRGGQAPWGAHVLTARGLVDAWLLLTAIPDARSVSRRCCTTSTYGSGAAAVLALAGRRQGATARAGLAVNAAALASMLMSSWTAIRLGHRPEPVGEEQAEWHVMPTEQVLARVASRPQGLRTVQAEERVQHPESQEGTPAVEAVARAALEDLGNPLTAPLATGAGLSAVLGSVTDAGLISAALALNALVGGVQRVRAERAIHRLAQASAAHVHVRRDGTEILVAADRLVVGDVVVLRAGDAVPADCRVLESQGVEVDEASLTGESQTVTKRADPSPARALADRHSMLYAGTGIAAGEVAGVVVAVGQDTEMGRSARAPADAPRRPSGVESRLRGLTSRTVPLALGAGAAVVGAGLVRGRRVSDTLATGVGLAVAAVPEGLPIVATVAQLASSRRLSARHALVRHHATVEALGRIDVLCADKTGTLTTGRISVGCVSDGQHDEALGGPDGPEGPEVLSPLGRQILAAGVRATAEAGVTGHVPHPTDRAVLEAASAAGIPADAGATDWQTCGELPFEPSRGYHAVLGTTGDGLLLTVKGAPEVVLPRCTRRRGARGSAPLAKQTREQIARHVDELGRRGYRVLAVAERRAETAGSLEDGRVRRLELIGLLAMADPVRASAAEAVTGLRAAGVDVVMVTGDHPSTAEAIAVELGLLNGGGILTGPALDDLTDDELQDRVDGIGVFARVSPAQKVRIVQALQRRGRTVAMTGDGANDAAAIQLADVGVAIGRHATNAAKEAADMVVTNDDIETLIDAILEGRAMWASVRDAVAVLVGGNLGEIGFTLLSEMLSRNGSPLNARQLLLVNLLTDLVPAMALAVRPPSGADPQTLAREGPEASLGASLTRDVVLRGAVTAAAGGAGWGAARLTGATRHRAGTVALVSIVGSQLGQTLVAGRRNPLVVGSSVASAAALAGVVQTPGLSHFFGCRPLGPIGWGIGAASAAGSSLVAPVAQRLFDRAGIEKR